MCEYLMIERRQEAIKRERCCGSADKKCPWPCVWMESSRELMEWYQQNTLVVGKAHQVCVGSVSCRRAPAQPAQENPHLQLADRGEEVITLYRTSLAGSGRANWGTFCLTSNPLLTGMAFDWPLLHVISNWSHTNLMRVCALQYCPIFSYRPGLHG